MTLTRRSILGVLAAVSVLGAACEPAPAPPPPVFTGCDVAVVGDSLTKAARPFLAESFASRDCTLRWVDAEENRRTVDGIAILEARAKKGDLPPVLIVGLGTNDRFQQQAFPDHIETVMRLAAGRQVIWIELAYNPLKAKLNHDLRYKAERHSNLTVMEWNNHYWSKPEYRSSDDVHATPAGSALRAELMAAAAERVAK